MNSSEILFNMIRKALWESVEFEKNMLEMVIEEQEVKLEELTSTRFEPGIIGLIVEYNKKRYYIMPNDAIVHSIMSFHQMLNHIILTLK